MFSFSMFFGNKFTTSFTYSQSSRILNFIPLTSGKELFCFFKAIYERDKMNPQHETSDKVVLIHTPLFWTTI